jgi:dihydrofolate reductase
MKVTQYNAISIDGFIDDIKGDSSWVSESYWAEFAKYVKEKKAIIMGRKTYEAGLELFPYDCELNIVMTRDKELIKSMENKQKVMFTNQSPEIILSELGRMGYSECLVIGGGDINSQFLEKGLINEIVLSVHPLILSKGLKLYESSYSPLFKLERLSIKEMSEGLVQIVYKVINN